MRLRELNPELHRGEGPSAKTWLYFDCPHCRAPREIQIPMRAGDGVKEPASYVWGWNGSEDFDTLTVTPSIDLKGHWHGHVKNGEVTTC